ncbi:ATP-dependent DNA ligase [uncultured virus]|nr:ATP-dependent DNA ligase [uncultured virus]
MDLGVTWLPTLYNFDGKGKLRIFRAGYQGGDYYSETGMAYKADGSPGKLIARKTKVPTNTRSKTPEAAAKARATQEWDERQRKDTYRTWNGIPTCTAAEWRNLDDRKWVAVCKSWEDIKFDQQICTAERPWIGQPKVDGDRTSAWLRNGEVKLYSRACLEKEFMTAIRQELLLFIPQVNAAINRKLGVENGNYGIDGEVLDPTKEHHQQTRSITARTVNRHVDEGSLVLKIFDIMEYTMTTQERFDLIDELRPVIADYKHLEFLPSKKLTDEGEIYQFREDAKAMGYVEGIVLRRPDLLYTTQKEHKDHNMVKFKYCQDAEYEVIGYKEGSGDRQGCVVWHLKDPKNESITFHCQQMGTLEDQRDLFGRADDYIGKLLTIKFMNKTAEGVPFQPRAVRFRPDEDIAFDQK